MIKYSGCTGKIPFFTQLEAQSYIRGLKVRSNQSSYKCKHLFYDLVHWHITSIPKGVLKKIKNQGLKYENHTEHKKWNNNYE